MAGCLDTLVITVPKMPLSMESIREYLGERKNLVVSVAAGVLFWSGWWFAIDAAAVYTDTDKAGYKRDIIDVFHICGVFATISMFMVNAISNGQIRGDSYTTGCMGVGGARLWLFVGFLMGFGALFGAFYILIGEYLVGHEGQSFAPQHNYPGVAIFMQNILIFGSSMLYKFGRQEEGMW